MSRESDLAAFLQMPSETRRALAEEFTQLKLRIQVRQGLRASHEGDADDSIASLIDAIAAVMMPSHGLRNDQFLGLAHHTLEATSNAHLGLDRRGSSISKDLPADVRRRLEDPQPETRIAALRDLRSMNDLSEKLVVRTIQKAFADPDWDVYESAYDELELITESDLDFCVAYEFARQSPNRDVVFDGVECLADHPHPMAARSLCDLVESEDLQVASWAVEALLRLVNENGERLFGYTELREDPELVSRVEKSIDRCVEIKYGHELSEDFRLLEADPLLNEPKYQGAWSMFSAPSSWGLCRDIGNRSAIELEYRASFARQAAVVAASARAGRFHIDKDRYATMVARLVWEEIGPRFFMTNSEFVLLSESQDKLVRGELRRIQLVDRHLASTRDESLGGSSESATEVMSRCDLCSGEIEFGQGAAYFSDAFIMDFPCGNQLLCNGCTARLEDEELWRTHRRWPLRCSGTEAREDIQGAVLAGVVRACNRLGLAPQEAEHAARELAAAYWEDREAGSASARSFWTRGSR